MSEQRRKGIFGKFSIGNGINEENKGTFTENAAGTIGEVEQTETDETTMSGTTIGENVGTIRNTALPTKVGFWQKFKNFWLQEIDWNKEIKVELTPKQQKIEDEINEFLHQEITWEKVHDFLFQEVKFGKK